MPRLKAGSAALGGLMLAVWTCPLQAQESLRVLVTAVPNPVPAGTCAGIVVDVRDASNQQVMTLANGLQLHSRSWDYTVQNPADFAWHNNDPGTGYLCARPGAGAVSASLTAIIRGTNYAGSTVVAIQPTAIAPATTGNPQAPGAYPQPAAPAPAGAPQPAAAVPAGYPPPAAAPPAGYPPPAVAPPVGYPQPVAQAPSGYAQPAAPLPAGYTDPNAGGYQPTSATTPGTPPTYPPQAYPQPATAVLPQTPAPPAPPPAEAQPSVKSAGGFFKKIGGHLKQKAGQVKTETTEQLANTATQVIDTTFETGKGVVSSTAAEAGNTARMGVGGVGKVLKLPGQRGGGSADNLELAVASGRAVLRAMRFTGNTDVLEPSSRELVERLAGELNKVLKGSPAATFLISAHVDSLPGPTAAQQLSEHRAAAVKQALIKSGVDASRLIALGYGTSQWSPEAGINARVEVARTQ